MSGIVANFVAVLGGTILGALFKRGLAPRFEQVLYTTLGLAALGIGFESVSNYLPKSHYPVLFIISLALGGLAGTGLRVADHFDQLIARFANSRAGQGIATGLLLYCIGALSIVGPVMAATKGDQSMLLTNASLNLVTAVLLGASFGWPMLVCAPILFCWLGAIYWVAKDLSATFFTGALVTELAIVGGFLIVAAGLNLLRLKEIKTVDFLPALLVPIIFFLCKPLF